MKYKNAVKVFPKELLIEVRKYVSEGFLYIPCIDERKDWGSISGQKDELKTRNQLICKEFQKGKTIDEIAREHYLAKSSIYRILKECKQ